MHTYVPRERKKKLLFIYVNELQIKKKLCLDQHFSKNEHGTETFDCISVASAIIAYANISE